MNNNNTPTALAKLLAILLLWGIGFFLGAVMYVIQGELNVWVLVAAAPFPLFALIILFL